MLGDTPQGKRHLASTESSASMERITGLPRCVLHRSFLLLPYDALFLRQDHLSKGTLPPKATSPGPISARNTAGWALSRATIAPTVPSSRQTVPMPSGVEARS